MGRHAAAASLGVILQPWLGFARGRSHLHGRRPVLAAIGTERRLGGWAAGEWAWIAISGSIADLMLACALLLYSRACPALHVLDLGRRHSLGEDTLAEALVR